MKQLMILVGVLALALACAVGSVIVFGPYEAGLFAAASAFVVAVLAAWAGARYPWSRFVEAMRGRVEPEELEDDPESHLLGAFLGPMLILIAGFALATFAASLSPNASGVAVFTTVLALCNWGGNMWWFRMDCAPLAAGSSTPTTSGCDSTSV